MVLRRNKNMVVEGRAVSHYYINFCLFANVLILCRFSDIVCGLLFPFKQFSSAEFAICNVHIADKNRRSYQVQYHFAKNLRNVISLHSTE